MDKQRFVYVTYIQASPEKVWDALMNPELTKQYWFGHHNVSDWKVGSSWKHQMADDTSVVHIVGKVIESDPPKRLVVSWVSPDNEGNDEKTSRVTYEIEPFDKNIKLTVTHEDLYKEMFESVSFGWPIVLSNLKTLLETGKAMAIEMRKGDCK
jgi:uncharacterized protein YndB with AHSA1/START domain